MILFASFKVPPMSEICLVPKTKFASQYPGLYIFTSTARMIRPVWNLATDCKEWIGTFEQVYMDICITPEEAIQGVRDQEVRAQDSDHKRKSTVIYMKYGHDIIKIYLHCVILNMFISWNRREFLFKPETFCGSSLDIIIQL